MIRILIMLAALLAALPAASATEAGWALLREGGRVVLLRNANAPGSGEPANFDIENCRTQRNLSDRGRQQSRRIGSLIAARAAPVEAVYSSRFCRTLETARIAFEEEPEPLEALDPPLQQGEVPAANLAAIADLVTGFTGSGILVLVTDDSVIRALTGSGAREAEALIVSPGEGRLQVDGRILFN